MSSRKKTKPRSTAKSPADRVYIGEIDNAESWDIIVNILCKCLDLPDLSSRAGLKQVHANFNTIYGRMDAFYQQNLENAKVRGAIVGIYAKMCVDALLRNKLFEKGVLDKVMPLCQIDETRHLALRALSTITHHGGTDVRMELAKHSNALCELLQRHPDDEKVAELVIVTLAHCISAVAGGDITPGNPAVLKQINMPAVLRSVLEAVRRPHKRPGSMIAHAIELVVMSSMHASAAMKAYPPAISFLVAGLRSKDWITRSSCLGGLYRMHILESDQELAKVDINHISNAIKHGVPDHLVDILMDYGNERTDFYIAMSSLAEYQQLMMACLRDHDLHKLGLALAKLVIRSEIGVSDGRYETADPKTGRRSDMNTGLPFTRWVDALPHCARAIRTAGNPDEQDFADILDIKYHILNRSLKDATRVAKVAIARNPEHAYFYYACTLSNDCVQGLRAAKKGLKCKILPLSIKYRLLQRAVDHAAAMGMQTLQDIPTPGDKNWEEGVAFFMCAFDDAKAYMASAPPDNLHLKEVCQWFVLLTMLISEKLSPDLRELKPTFEKLKLADEFTQLVSGLPPSKTNLRLAQESAVRHYAAGIKDFAPLFETHDKLRFSGEVLPPVDSAKTTDDLSAWLDNIRLEDGTIEDLILCKGPGYNKAPKVDYEHITLYRCSWCGHPSAVLRKCSNCSEARYCDGACQKSHWPIHKKKCKK